MENNEIVQMVDCCKTCIHSDTGEHLQMLGWCSKHEICVMKFV